MWKIISAQFLICLILGSLSAQPKQVGVPVLGIPTHQAIQIIAAIQGEGEIFLGLKPDSSPSIKPLIFAGNVLIQEREHRQIQFILNGLNPGTKYQYQLYAGKKCLSESPYTFQTPYLWEWRSPAPDFTVLMGSCVYINESEYDRPGTPYGKSRDILYTMSKLPADFNLWLGDNTYLREVDYSSPSGMYYRNRHTRNDSAVQALLAARPNLAIWDDHDFGPNDADRSFDFKKQSLQFFQAFWPNPYMGTKNTPGAFCSVKYADVEFFLMDNRYYRAPNKMKTDDPTKDYWGEDQLQWLKDKLISSKAVFKIIVNGNQVLNSHANPTQMETMEIFPKEKTALLKCLSDYAVPGVLFLSGDRHFTELLKLERPGAYSLYDFTCSPLTSGVFEKIGETEEGKNPMRVPGSLITEHNFGRLSVTGPKGERVVKIESINSKGEVKFTWSVSQKDLK
jgi:alkaline phosphatase D